MRAVLLAALLALSGSALADFMPPNNLHLQDWMESAGPVDQEAFDRVNALVIGAYAPIVAKFGATLKLNAQWSNSTVNASAHQAGKVWNVNMYGGLARRPEVTEDGYAMVVCHELGHHLAGFPLYPSSPMASEGQADFWATQVCAKKIWSGADNSGAVTAEIPTKRCNSAYIAVKDRQLCYRIAEAGNSLAALLGALNGDIPKWDTPDQSVVNRTAPQHPDAQCRLDTYLAGGLCSVRWRDAVIPGRDNPNGQDGLFGQYDALAVSCNTKPRCWYAPL